MPNPDPYAVELSLVTPMWVERWETAVLKRMLEETARTWLQRIDNGRSDEYGGF